ncbi:MAG TPA: FAD binding domain-containing protein [Feifaniaceae bacterium]|nr:FAD binding domain-containing protein [Feifaniaceae bacterium]
MIPRDFIYCNPDTLEEAVRAFETYEKDGKRAYYYGGGSEIITMSRAGGICPDAVIDYKSVPECNVLETDGEVLKIGAALSLTAVKDAKRFPLLGSACGRVADHTNQCRITLGGNLCGSIRYRETSLPLLVSDAKLLLASASGTRTVPFCGIFQERMRLTPGELVIQALVPVNALFAPFAHIKKTSREKIDYPLVDVTAMLLNGTLRAAFSGVCEFPFRSEKLEAALNDRSRPIPERVRAAVGHLPAKPVTDAEGSGAYRLFMLERTLENLLSSWENGELDGAGA